MPHDSDSAPQRDAERQILELASEQYGMKLVPREIATPEGGKVQLDGVADDDSIIAEVYAHQGTLLAAQQKKVMTEALRLTWVRSWFAPDARAVICLACHEAASRVRWREDERRPQSWMAEALRDLGVDVEVFDLPDGGGSVRDAQTRQFR